MRHFPSLALSLSSLFFGGLASYPSLWFNQVSGAVFSSPGCSLTVQKKRHHYSSFSLFPSFRDYMFECCYTAHTFTAHCALQYYYYTKKTLPIPFALALTFIKSFPELWQSVTYSGRLFIPIYIFLLNVWAVKRTYTNRKDSLLFYCSNPSTEPASEIQKLEVKIKLKRTELLQIWILDISVSISWVVSPVSLII